MPAIAIISKNKDKYSETFIHQHVKMLPQTVSFLCEGYLPTMYSEDRLITFSPIINHLNNWLLVFRKKSALDKNQLINAIQSYLIKRKIKVIICEYGPSGVSIMHIAQKLNIPLIVHFHGYDAYRNDVLTFYREEYKELFLIAKQIIVVSRHMYNQLIQLGCEKIKLTLLTYGIDTTIFKFSNQKKSNLTFISCGRFVEKKAPLITIRAFAKAYNKNKSIRLIMIGDGELLSDAINLTNELHVNKAVEFKGVQSQNIISNLYSNSFAFLQHSISTDDHDSEGTPLSIMEAMSVGLPVISTKHGGILDIIKNGVNGLLVDERDVNGMTEKIELLIQNPELAREIGKKASEYIQKNYDINMYIKKLSDIVDKQLE
jgi:colanic acid/amylovoran biosynthesis glycosyltransferase